MNGRGKAQAGFHVVVQAQLAGQASCFGPRLDDFFLAGQLKNKGWLTAQGVCAIMPLSFLLFDWQCNNCAAILYKEEVVLMDSYLSNRTVAPSPQTS